MKILQSLMGRISYSKVNSMFPYHNAQNHLDI
jgi:hypothetical protein